MNKNTIFIIGFVWPEPNTTAAGSRMLQLIEFFSNEGYTIFLGCTASKTPFSLDLEALGITTFKLVLNDESFNTIIQGINPTIVLFDRFLTEEQFGWRVSEVCPNAIKILDTEDLHGLRKGRQQAFENKELFKPSLLLNNRTVYREISSILRCDLSIIISKYELTLLLTQFNIPYTQLVYLPFLVDELPLHHYDNLTAFNDRLHFTTVGNFNHAPNWQSVLYLKQNIWPLVKAKLPKAQFHVYGAYSKQKGLQLHNEKQGFYIKGWQKDIKQIFSPYRVCLAPLLFGAGLKGKLLDSMLYGTPSVTTDIGAEGMHDDLPWPGYIENSPEKFAEKAIELHQNSKLWQEAQSNALPIINQCYAKHKFLPPFKRKIDAIISDKSKALHHNIYSNMLNHHELQSTKFLSKYIEIKNKLEKFNDD